MICQLFDPVFGRAFQGNAIDFDLREVGRERICRKCFHALNVLYHARNRPFKLGFQIFIAADRTAELIFQRLQFSQPGLHFNLADQLGIAGNLRRKRGEINRSVVDLIHVAALPFQSVVDEFLLSGQNLIHPGVKRFLHAVADHLDLRQNIALTDQTSGPLLGVSRTERGIQIMFHRKTFLHIDAGSELLRRSHDDADIAAVHHVEHLLPLLVGFVVIDDRDFLGGNPACNQFPLDFTEYVEADRLAVFELEKVAEYDLRCFDGIVFTILFQNLIDADIELGTGIVLRIGGNQAQIDGRLAGEPVNQQRNVRKFPLFRVVELLEPGVNIAQIIHEARDLFRSRQIDLFRMPAFDRRFRNAGQILRQNHVRTAPEHLGELHDVREFAEPRNHFEASGGIQFHRRFALGKSRSETVKGVHMKCRQTFRRYVANHVEQFRKLVRDRRSRCGIDIPAARFFADLIQLQGEAERLLRSGVVQPFHPRHFRDEEVPFVAVNLVHEDAVHAQLVEVDDILGGMAVLQFVQTVFEAAFALFLRLFLNKIGGLDFTVQIISAARMLDIDVSQQISDEVIFLVQVGILETGHLQQKLIKPDEMAHHGHDLMLFD